MAETTIDLIEQIMPEIRSELGEPTPSFFTNDEIYRWFNYALRDFCRRTKILKTTTSYTWAANTDSVSLATILGTTTLNHLITYARWNNGSSGTIPLLVAKREVFDYQIDRDVTSYKGEPIRLYYSAVDATIGLDPTPDASGTLILDYSYELAELTESSSSLDTSLNRWWMDICAWPVYRGKLKDVDHFAPSEAQEALGRFEKSIVLARQDIQRRENPHQVVSFLKDYAPAYMNDRVNNQV